MNWDLPILTDSGGFQVFSLSKINKVNDDGVHFQSFIDGKKIFMKPEDSIEIQKRLEPTLLWLLMNALRQILHIKKLKMR